MGKLDVHMSSERMDWETPHEFFASLDSKFDFTLDVCAGADNTKVELFFTEEDDGLAQAWNGRCWMNPPYGRAIGKWLAKAKLEASDNPACEFVVCLVPARVDTAWWHDNVMYDATLILFVRGRLTFVGAKAGAPFPVSIVVFETGGPPMFQAITREGEMIENEG